MVRLCLQCLLWGCLLTAVHPEPTTECEGNRYLLNHQCCDLCEPGKKLRNDCTEDSPTQCISCAPGEFSKDWNRETRCHQHRVCESQIGLQVQSEGTSVTDTTCICQEGWHCISPACEKCAPHKVCDPGFGVTQKATGTSDTVCEPCPAGFFSSVSSASEECHPWTSCEAQDQVVLQEGTEHMDVVCGLHPRKRALVAIPIVMSILLAIFLLSVYIRKLVKKPKEPRRKDPVEDQEDLPDHIPVTPVQETLHGCQPVTQEDGKESRISVQERQ